MIELRKDADVENFKNMLYKKTRLEDTFGVNMLAISDGRPETMGLKAIIRESVNFQYEVAGENTAICWKRSWSARRFRKG